MLMAIGEPTFVLGLNYSKEFAVKAYRKKVQFYLYLFLINKINKNIF